MSLSYPARIERESDGFTVTFRDIPEAITAAYQYEEALARASEVLTFTLESLLAEGSHVPLPSAALEGEYPIVPDVSVQADVVRLVRGR